jgi:hypothetical protein
MGASSAGAAAASEPASRSHQKTQLGQKETAGVITMISPIKRLRCVASITGGFRIATDSPTAPLHNLPFRYLATIWATLGQNQFEKIGFDETISCEPSAQIAG